MQISQVHELRELRKDLNALAVRVNDLAVEFTRLVVQHQTHQAEIKLLTKVRNNNVRPI